MLGDERDPYIATCGQRLRTARMAAGFATIRRFASVMNEAEDNISNWERGVSMVPARFVERMKVLFGITADWIYTGDASTMRHDLAVKVASTNGDDGE